MLLIIGTVPEADFPLVEGEVELTGANLLVAGREIPVNRAPPHSSPRPRPPSPFSTGLRPSPAWPETPG